MKKSGALKAAVRDWRVLMNKFYGAGWDGALYPAGNSKDKIVIVFSGSEGGLEHAGKCCRYLQDNGIDSFALGYFKTKHSSKKLDLIPVEIFGDVIEKLKAMGYCKIGVEGVSKGAELALAAAIEYPEISCVIIKTPSWFYSEGLAGGQPSGNSCWSYRGQALPFTPYKERKIHMLKMIREAKEYNILPVNTGKRVLPESVIPVEKINAPILMFSTKVDTIWPSTESCEKICERLEANKFSYPYKHIAFEHMSHIMLEYCGKEIKYFIKSEKKDPAACFAERESMGKECVSWIQSVWQ
jgi:esterase/lipase